VRVISRCLILSIAFLAFSPVHGLTLGEVQIRSFLMEPLLAEIEIVEAKQDALRDLKIRMASQADFDRFGVERHAMHDAVSFTVLQKGGNWVVEVRSSKPVREPYFSFPVEAVWRDGQYVREYTVFLDPRPVKRAAVAQTRTAQPKSAPATQPIPAPVAPPSQPKPEPVAPPAQPKPAPVAKPVPPPKEFWPVKRGDTLWGIAERIKPSSATTPQMMMALLRANPEAFPDSNVNNLEAGSNLRIPDSGEIQSLTARQARKAFNEQTKQWREAMAPAEDKAEIPAKAAPQAKPDAVAMVEPPEAEPLEQPVVEGEPIEPAESASKAETEADSQLRIVAEPTKSTSQSPVAKEIAELERQLLLALEQTEADRLELETLDGRVGQIQAEMMRMRRLIILKNEQIAALQAVRDDAPLPPRVDIDKVAPRPDADAAAAEQKATNEDRRVAANIDSPQKLAAHPLAEVDWGIWLAVGAGLLGLLVLLTLYLRREREDFILANHPGVTPSRDRPYADLVSNLDSAQTDTVAVAPTGQLSEYDSAEDADTSWESGSKQLQEDWQRDDFGTDGSLAMDSRDSLETGTTPNMTDEELESLVLDLKGDFDSIDTGSPLAPEATKPTASDRPASNEFDIDGVMATGGVTQDGPTAGEGAVDTMSSEAEVTDVAALRLELAQAYLEIGEIDGARDILTQVVEESMEGPEQEEARRLLESLG